jgi:E3 ubiquitin-protein ligase BRE1
MTAVEGLPLSLSQQSLVKMEDRKRPSPYETAESAPPLKRQATGANGASKSHRDDDMPWKDDLEVRINPRLRPLSCAPS